MPIVEGMLDVPVKEWCSVWEGVLWIERGQVPIARRWESYFPKRQRRTTDIEIEKKRYPQSMKKLYAMACADNLLRIKGRRPTGDVSLCFLSDMEVIVKCEKLADEQYIHSIEFIDAGIDGFDCAFDFDVLASGRLDSDDTSVRYFDLKINFEDLSKANPKKFKKFRIGSDVLPIIKGKSGPKGYSGDNLLSLMAAILEFKAFEDDVQSDGVLMGIFEEAYNLIYGADTAPSRGTLQSKVIWPLKAARQAYRDAMSESEEPDPKGARFVGRR